MTIPLIPTRSAGLDRLAAFVPKAGRAYAASRNTDPGPGSPTGVSGLSPYIRYRLVTEAEVVAAVLGQHDLRAAEKFIQEVCWRTYWKGWLQQRPAVWDSYLETLAEARADLRADTALAAAEAGATGIDAFDAWAQELITTGTLHNHTRMWFASIWIFTLKLPWTLGADFFLRHLADGDPASNTLSWRWVAGLHTRGKTYLARADNIATYTNGRFRPRPEQLAAFAEPLAEGGPFERTALLSGHEDMPPGPLVLLVTPEDLAPELWPVPATDVRGIALAPMPEAGPAISPLVARFRAGAFEDVAQRVAERWSVPIATVHDGSDLTRFMAACGSSTAVTSMLPVGPWRPEIDAWRAELAAAGVAITEFGQRWDRLFWPHAKAGFFQLKDKIPVTLQKLGLTG